jgi:hypothetical protein
MAYDDTVSRRRRLPIFLPLALVIGLAAAWSGFWYFAASKAHETLEGWRAREAQEGRIHTCASENVSGFPFRLEVRCMEPTTELRSNQPPVVLKSQEVLAAVQVYDPTLLLAEFSGPLTIAEPGQSPAYAAHWRLAQASVRGTPLAPERVSIVIDGPTVERTGQDGSSARVLGARRVELHGRLIAGSVSQNPVIELVLRAAAAAAPDFHPATAQPLDADISTTLRGLADFSPKPWPMRFRELQERKGSIEVIKARVQQGDVIAVAAGTLGLTPRGSLDGQMQVTVVGIEQVLKALDLEKIMSEGRVGQAVGALDRLVPGLSNLARQNARPGIIAGLGAIGQSTILEGKPAVTLPLRFVDGAVMLGPFPVGRVPPLF